MAITKTTTPYEFLVRWKDGAIAGAHIKFLETVSENGVVLSQKEGIASPVSMAGESGFPIADLLTTVQTQALTDLAAAQAVISNHPSGLAAKDAEIAALQAQVTALTPVAVVNGIPQSVSMRQARLALLGAGLLTAVTNAISALPEPAKSAALIEWEYSNEVWRSKGFVVDMAGVLGLTSQQLDDLFVAAAAL